MAVPECSRNHPGGRIKPLIRKAVGAAVIFGLNALVMVKLFPKIAFLRDYAGDVLALPLFLPLSIASAQWLGLYDSSRGINLRHVLLATGLFALIFELLLPQLDSRATADLMDVVAYLCGGLILFGLDRRSFPPPVKADH